MVVRKTRATVLDGQFRALADATRRDIVKRTMRREYAVTELAGLFPMSFAAVQRHVAVLERAGLVTKRADHRHRYVRAHPGHIAQLARELDSVAALWQQRVERMHHVLDEPGGQE